jgi:hypothetical protein
MNTSPTLEASPPTTVTKSKMAVVLAPVPDRNPSGTLRFGSIVRLGVIRCRSSSDEEGHNETVPRGEAKAARRQEEWNRRVAAGEAEAARKKAEAGRNRAEEAARVKATVDKLASKGKPMTFFVLGISVMDGNVYVMKGVSLKRVCRCPSFPLPKVPGGATEASQYTIAARSASPLVPFVSATCAMMVSVELLNLTCDTLGDHERGRLADLWVCGS